MRSGLSSAVGRATIHDDLGDLSSGSLADVRWTIARPAVEFTTYVANLGQEIESADRRSRSRRRGRRHDAAFYSPTSASKGEEVWKRPIFGGFLPSVLPPAANFSLHFRSS